MGKQAGVVAALLRGANAAVAEAQHHSCRVRAWELLQERDPDGNAKGPLPYTDAAIGEFEEAHRRDPANAGIVHHLAIAHHARAWDLELQGDPRAEAEWQCALDYWRTVGASVEFWAALEAKVCQVDSKADPAIVHGTRRDLLENLLDVHVDFIRYYCELDRPERAMAHVNIVNQALIPPAVKKRLVDKVYGAMTGSVAEANAQGERDSALTILERFLQIYPGHVGALRSYATICGQAVAALSYRDDWDALSVLIERADAHAERLALDEALPSESLAEVALRELVDEVVLRAKERANSLFGSDEAPEGLPDASKVDEQFAVFSLALRWGRWGLKCRVPSSFLEQVLPGLLLGLGSALFYKGCHALADPDCSDEALRRNAATCLALYDESIAAFEEAAGLVPGDDAIRENLDIVRQKRASEEAIMRMLGRLD